MHMFILPYLINHKNHKSQTVQKNMYNISSLCSNPLQINMISKYQFSNQKKWNRLKIHHRGTSKRIWTHKSLCTCLMFHHCIDVSLHQILTSYQMTFFAHFKSKYILKIYWLIAWLPNYLTFLRVSLMSKYFYLIIRNYIINFK